MIQADPDRFFVPPYVGPSGWIGIWLDRNPTWSEVGDLVRDAYRLTAPKRLLAMLDGDAPRKTERRPRDASRRRSSSV
jgi:hypothetical protein